LHCSLLSRNALLISGVVASHLLVLMSLLYGSFSGERSFVPGALAVSLVGERATSPLPEKSITPKKNSSSSKESLSSIQADGSSSPVGTQSASHLMGHAARQPLHSPKPHYPLASRKLREQGLVVVKLCVNEQGIVGEVGVSKSSGFHGLDQSALRTLAQWRFNPLAPNSGNLSLQCFQTPVQFTLEG
jgi:protein TonB